jgi:hypothetical protein
MDRVKQKKSYVIRVPKEKVEQKRSYKIRRAPAGETIDTWEKLSKARRRSLDP